MHVYLQLLSLNNVLTVTNITDCLFDSRDSMLLHNQVLHYARARHDFFLCYFTIFIK